MLMSNGSGVLNFQKQFSFSLFYIVFNIFSKLHLYLCQVEDDKGTIVDCQTSVIWSRQQRPNFKKFEVSLWNFQQTEKLFSNSIVVLFFTMFLVYAQYFIS